MCKDEISLQGNALFAVKATACLVAWQRPEGKLWLLKSVGHKFVLGSTNVLLCSGAFMPSLTSVSSYGEQGGLILRRPCHISDTGMAGGLCVSCSGVWARPNVQTSNHSPPSRSGKASPLWWKHNTHGAVSAGPEVKLAQPPPPWGEKKSVLSCS